MMMVMILLVLMHDMLEMLRTWSMQASRGLLPARPKLVLVQLATVESERVKV